MANNFESQIALKVSDGANEIILMRDGALIIGTEDAYYLKDDFLAWLEDPSHQKCYAQPHLAYLSTLDIEVK
jgi:hypothetical protein